MKDQRKSGKANRTGRNEVAGNDHWTKLVRSLMETDAWRALPSVAQALYPWIKLEWKGAQANNNGQIRFSVRQAASLMGVSINTAARAFHELQAKGFLVMTEAAVLGVDGAAKSPAFEITEIAVNPSRDGRRHYLNWRPGGDHPVQKSKSNNPSGHNGKTKPRLNNDDAPVIEIETFRKVLSQK